jgi:hypothetical protein
VSYPAILTFLSGAIVTAFLACGVFFLKFWWRSRAHACLLDRYRAANKLCEPCRDHRRLPGC